MGELPQKAGPETPEVVGVVARRRGRRSTCYSEKRGAWMSTLRKKAGGDTSEVVCLPVVGFWGMLGSRWRRNGWTCFWWNAD